jgi:branched-subunit amino acid ABC-type transport system permease component/ABC-type branched-subunit amino acid transport system ATPase component
LTVKDVLVFAMLGFASGAAYALIAQGLIVVHRGTGVVNFAQASIAMFSAYTYVQLVDSAGLNKILAAIVTTLMSGVLGGIIQRFVMRPLGRAPLLARLVATLGVVLVLEAGVVLIYGVDVKAVPSLFPTTSVVWGGVHFGEDRLVLPILALLLALVLSFISRRTVAGSLLRAAADSEEGVAILGYSLNTVSAGTWIIGSMLAGFAGIVVAPITGLSVTSIILLVIPALSVSLLAGFSSFWIATAAALALGVAQSELANYWTISSPTAEGMQQALPFLVIIALVVVRGRAIPGRATIAIGRPPVAPRPRANPLVLAVLAAAAVLVCSVANNQYQTGLAVAFISAIIALSLVVLTGYVGQISLAQMSFAGLGAFFCARYATDAGIPFPLPILISALTVVPCGVILALPAVRVRGLSLAVVTLGAAVTIDSVLFDDSSLTGGFNGISVPSPSIFGYSVDGILTPFRFAMVALIALALCIAGVAMLRRSRLGLKMLAVRDNERAAAAEGISVFRVKVIAFAIASFLAALGGSLFGYLYGHISFDQFATLTSVEFVATAYIGGIGSISGAVVAGMISAGGPLFVLFSSNDTTSRYQEVISGVGVILTAILNPDGIAPYTTQNLRALGRRRRAAGLRAPSTSVAPPPPASPGAPTRRSRPTLDSEPPLLAARGMNVQFSGVRAVSDVDFIVNRGTMVGLIGPNGAGKTTLIDAICGFVQANGQVEFGQRQLGKAKAHERARAGLRRTFQNTELFDDLTIRENLSVPAPARGDSDLGDITPDEIVELLGLTEIQDAYPRELSNGEAKLVGVARALMGGPRLLMLDEPAAGLDSQESQVLGDRLLALVDRGLSLVLVDHDLELVMRTCDRVDVLDRGCLIASGPPEDVRNDPAVRRAYIGGADSVSSAGGGRPADGARSDGDRSADRATAPAAAPTGSRR